MLQGKVHKLKVPIQVHTELLEDELRYFDDNTNLKGHI